MKKLGKSKSIVTFFMTGWRFVFVFFGQGYKIFSIIAHETFIQNGTK